jgi:hypothetical protein
MRMLYHQAVHAKVFESYDNWGYTGVSYSVALATEEGTLGESCIDELQRSGKLIYRDIVIEFGETIWTHLEKEAPAQRIGVGERSELRFRHRLEPRYENLLKRRYLIAIDGTSSIKRSQAPMWARSTGELGTRRG